MKENKPLANNPDEQVSLTQTNTLNRWKNYQEDTNLIHEILEPDLQQFNYSEL